MPWTRNGICVCFEGKPAETIWIFFKVLRFYRLHLKNDKKNNEKGLTKLISLNSVRPFCWFHTYYLITTRFRINNAKISRVIILLSNRTLSALKCPVYKGFQKIFIIQTLLCQVVLWCFSLVWMVEIRKFCLISTYCVDFREIILSFCCHWRYQ